MTKQFLQLHSKGKMIMTFNSPTIFPHPQCKLMPHSKRHRPVTALMNMTLLNKIKGAFGGGGERGEREQAWEMHFKNP